MNEWMKHELIQSERHFPFPLKPVAPASHTLLFKWQILHDGEADAEETDLLMCKVKVPTNYLIINSIWLHVCKCTDIRRRRRPLRCHVVWRAKKYSDQSHHLNNAGITVPLTLNQVSVGQRRNSSLQVHFASNKHSLGVKMTTELVRNSQWHLHWAVRRFAGPDININCEFVCRQYIDIS